MKRTGFKPRKTPMKRSPIVRHNKKKGGKKSPLKLAKDKAWTAFSKYIRLRDSLRTTGTIDRCICVTCGREFPSFGKGCIHAGHWLGGRHGLNLFSEQGCHAQCMGCNMIGAGQQVKYTAFMLEHYGHEVMDRIVRTANTPYKWTVDELEEIERKYTAMTEQLVERHG